jgi:hypothetical protein
VIAADLEQALRKSIRGEVRFDAGSRALYASDASNYRQVPVGLVVPRDAEDVAAAVRPAGSSACLSCPGRRHEPRRAVLRVAVVLDFTKYMNRILEIDPERRFARRTRRRPRYPGAAPRRTSSRSARTRPRTAAAPWRDDRQQLVRHARCSPAKRSTTSKAARHLYDGTELSVGAAGDADLDAIARQGGRRADSTRSCGRFGIDTPTPFARSSRASPDGSPATTWMTCSPNTDSTSRARWSAAKAPAPSSSTRR